MANAVYIIGNGFDIRMGMPTGYPDFLKYYETLAPPSNEVGEIKARFCNMLEQGKAKAELKDRWADLEVALGDFTKEESNIEVFKSFLRDCNFSLIDYLKREEKLSTAPSEEEKAKFFADLYCPENYLRSERLLREFNHYAVSKSDIGMNIISFNYTNTIETLLEGEIGNNSNINIKHIHRTLKDNRVLFGVNSIEQIGNEEFRKDEAFLDLIVKPKGNYELGTLIDEQCKSMISNGDIFYIFGTSLGVTDQDWWDNISRRYKGSNCVILYFEHTDNEIIRDDLDIPQLERNTRNRIMRIMDFAGEEIDYRDRIYIARNTDIFPYRKKRVIK